ncbi:TRAP transporter large permease subunit [Reichenbachiella carrageenanivorans]|uniref:TRAP transporter large permease subunit n=1 Tax=Reichenbachiella carrageenanivorans TaxID=2979869 RepID=A0ABY6D3R1_9BACT|nr:TRAP transporter large permease subunit [Reichenbachiella carrageenanivorans]UXX80791.1 TRAP transporter large permease subunit [Reichenbachiella carrageenanivorans]
MISDYLPLLLFALVFALILFGYPVAFTLGGLSVLTGILIYDVDFFYLLSLRIYGTMHNFVLIAVPLFVFMGIMLEKSGLAESLLETMASLFGRMKGGLAVSVVIVGGMLAASTGIVGATVITMGMISLPTMLKRGYSPTLATGTIASSGTLGQIIPPSVVLVLLGTVLNVSVGDLFTAAIVPGVLLVGLYILYIIVVSYLVPGAAPSMSKEELPHFSTKQVLVAFVLPFTLILLVLGSIFAGIASPTEAAAVGAIGSIVLTAIQKKLNLTILKEVMRDTTFLTCMVFMILVGATSFSLIFRAMGGDRLLADLITQGGLSPNIFLFVVLLVVFIAGFFIDFIEIIFIIIPVAAPIFSAMGIDLIWIGILIALNLQTSFLTPPFGFSLFYLKGVAPPEIKTSHLYRGIVPFVLIQILLLISVIIFPELISWLPEALKD